MTTPTVELGLAYKKDDRLFDEVQNTGVIESNGQKEIGACDRRCQKRTGIDKGNGAQYSKQTSDGYVLEPP